jgi:hypothetical protein
MVQHVVLLSGGWESTGCLIKALRTLRPTYAIFFDYGQPYWEAEADAVVHIAQSIEVGISVGWNVYDGGVRLPIVQSPPGHFVDRNAQMLRAAARRYPGHELWLGARAPLAAFDRHGDSNWQFARAQARELGVPVHVPFIGWPKAAVRAFVARYVDPALIYSSEGYHYQ